MYLEIIFIKGTRGSLLNFHELPRTTSYDWLSILFRSFTRSLNIQYRVARVGDHNHYAFAGANIIPPFTSKISSTHSFSLHTYSAFTHWTTKYTQSCDPELT